jgi:hypothetical protein
VASASAARPAPASASRSAARPTIAVSPSRAPEKPQAAGAAKAQRSQPAENASRSENIERIVRVVRLRMGSEHSHTIMRLDPPELGSLRLEMDLRGHALALRVDTSTELAHRLLSEDVEELRRGLEASGIQLGRVEIRPPALPAETSEHDASQWADTREDAQTRDEPAESDAEHPEEGGMESCPAGATEEASRGNQPEPTAESLVNVIA